MILYLYNGLNLIKMSSNEMYIYEYSEKSIAVFGNTTPHKEILEELEQTLDEALDYKFQGTLGLFGKLKKLFDTEENKHERIKKLKMTTLIAEGINKKVKIW